MNQKRESYYRSLCKNDDVLHRHIDVLFLYRKFIPAFIIYEKDGIIFANKNMEIEEEWLKGKEVHYVSELDLRTHINKIEFGLDWRRDIIEDYLMLRRIMK